MRIYGLKSCDTCRKALKALPNALLIDVRDNGVPASVLSRALLAFGDQLVNTRSTTWRGLGESDRDLPPGVLIDRHPAVMKRPLIEAGDGLWLGWTAATREALGAA